MSLMQDAMFKEYRVINCDQSRNWDDLITSEQHEELMAIENEITGPTNLLSDALRTGFSYNCIGGQFDFLLPRITYLAKHLKMVDEYDADGFTPLMTAVKWGHTDAVRALLERVPADVNILAFDHHFPPNDTEGTCGILDHIASVITRDPDWQECNLQVIKRIIWYTSDYIPCVTESLILAIPVGVLCPIVVDYLWDAKTIPQFADKASKLYARLIK
jgi:hypothetical protein